MALTIKNSFIIKISSIACIIACIGDIAAMFFLGDYYPGYSQLRNTMSSLGASISPVSNLISIWWIIAGFLIIFFGIGFKKAFVERGKYAKIVSWLLILYGIGEEIGSGLFKDDRVANELTVSGNIHNIFGGIGVVSILLLPLYMKKVISKKEMPSFHKLSTIVFAIGLTMLLLFSFRFLDDTNSVLIVYKGLWQRLSMLNNYIYLVTIAIIMLKKTS